ncbi:hypothetical protein MPSEU_000744200 [Mayamaea pseudoterrestris]|nr:hypothetical protein MPSEU_000744200 [Mayamaea pseudoterrestris]
MGGDVHDVASSGEKSRFLLALESSLPGCVGAVRRRNLHGGALLPSVPPIAVIYDEIDAHVGGSAADALATMLASQARNCQIVAITHSPPVGALADLHLVVRKSYNIDEFNKGVGPRTVVNVTEVDKSERRLELARMASGDLATSEAQMFAEALIREGVIRRDATKELY